MSNLSNATDRRVDVFTVIAARTGKIWTMPGHGKYGKPLAGRFTTLTTPLGKPALAGEQVYHIDHIAATGLFSRWNGKKGRGYDMYREKDFKEK